MSDNKSEDLIQELRRLVPLNALIPQHFKRVLETTSVEEVEAGADLFKEGDEDGHAFYVLEGLVDIFAQGELLETVESDTFPARHPLAPSHPRNATATTKTRARIAKAETALLDTLLAWGQSSRDDVGNLDDIAGEDWLARMLQLTLFQKLPPGNLQQAIKRMEEVKYAAGQNIVEQGSRGDYFFVIRKGHCEVSRKSTKNADPIKLAELSQGDSFGEEALVSGGNRNATVTMLTPGVILRLAKHDFIQLIKQPLHIEIDYYKAESLIGSGARWLDVRLPVEYQKSCFSNSVNLPLPAFRIQLAKLKKDLIYVCYCDTGRRSSIAAYLMREKGFEAYVLSAGIMSLPSGVFLSVGERPVDTDPLSQTLVSPAQIERAFDEVDETIATTEALKQQQATAKPKAPAPPKLQNAPQRPKTTHPSKPAPRDPTKDALKEVSKILGQAKEDARQIRAKAEGVWKKAESQSTQLLAKANDAIAKAKVKVDSAKKKQALLNAQAVDAVRMNRLREQLTETLAQKKHLQNELEKAKLLINELERQRPIATSGTGSGKSRLLVILVLVILVGAAGGAVSLMPKQVGKWVPALQKILPATDNATVQSTK